MKTHFILAALVLLPLAAHAQRQGQNQIGPTIRTDRFYETSAALAEEAVANRQYVVMMGQSRVVGGETNRLSDPGWVRLGGTVLQNVAGGKIVMGNGERIFLVQAPPVADDLPFNCWAKDTGEFYSYTTVAGGSKSIRKFDHGLVVSNAPVTYAEPVRVLTPEEKSAMNDRVLKYQRENAEKGLPSFQFIMGQRHLKGDGVPRDAKLARDYFEKSAKQGDTDARAALTNFPAFLGTR